MNTPGASDFYVGGGLPPDERSYVVRPVDNEIFDALRAGHLCYVLNSRQMGKSSLCNRTLARLREQNVATAIIDVSVIDIEPSSKSSWYAGLIQRLNSAFRVMSEEALARWWLEQSTGPLSRLGKFIEEHVIGIERPNCVIFFDEIDSLIASSVGDSFFTLLRSIYNRRASEPHLRKLTVALIGVASPSELISDKSHTPFNVGYPIELRFFTLDQAYPALAPLLLAQFSEPRSILKAIFDWTGGQPFLTQKACSLMVANAVPLEKGEEGTWVSEIVRSHIVEQWESQDEPVHLRTIRDRILQSPKKIGARLLGLIQRIQSGERVSSDDSDEQVELRLTGLVVEAAGYLVIANQIYSAVFTLDWTQRALGSLRPYGESIEKWRASTPRDGSFLLRGTALEAAREWAAGRALPAVDFEYLDASGRAQTDLVEVALDAEREANEILRAAGKTAFRRMVSIIAVSVTASALLVFGSVRTTVRNQNTTEIAKIQASSAMRSYEQARIERTLASTQLEESKRTLNVVNSEVARRQVDLKRINARYAAEIKKGKQDLVSAREDAEKEKQQLQIQFEEAKKEASRAQEQVLTEKADSAKMIQSESKLATFTSAVQSRLVNSDHINIDKRADSVIAELQADDELHDARIQSVKQLAEKLPRDDTQSLALLYHVLYLATSDKIWRDKLFELLISQPNSASLDLSKATWNIADIEEVVMRTSSALLADSKDSLSDSRFELLWSFDGFRDKKIREQHWGTYFDLIQLTVFSSKDKDEAKTAWSRLFLRGEAPAAYLALEANYLARGEDSPEAAEVFAGLSDLRWRNCNIPKSLGHRQWQKWIDRRKKWLSLWLEPRLNTLRRSPELVSQSEKALGLEPLF